ncbi:MAG: hypothetical protein FWH41_02665, partial [Treponema sp.]|nr:hypothetical protein [Treponema sp.]
DIGLRIQEYLTGIPNWTKDSWEKPKLQGVCIDIGETGKARSIERISINVAPPPVENTENKQDEIANNE